MSYSQRPCTATEIKLSTKPGKLTPDEYNALVKGAIQLDLDECKLPESGKYFPQVCKEKIVVPKIETVPVPITREVMKPGFKTHTVKGCRLVPQHKTREEVENVIEVKEEIVKCKRIVWKPCEEEYYETIKKPVQCTRTKIVPYTEYCEEEVEMTVEVPCDTLVYEKGCRYDKKLGTEVVEVEKTEYYQMVPTKCDDPTLIKQEPKGKGIDYGRIEVGHEIFDGCEVPCETKKPKTSYGNSMEVPEEMEADYPEVNAFAAFESSMRPGTGRSQLSTSAGRPKTGASVQLGKSYSRPPTGALYQDPRTGQMVRVPAGGVHPSVAALMMPSQPRLNTGMSNSGGVSNTKPNLMGRPGTQRAGPSWR